MKPFDYERAVDPAAAVATVTGNAGAMFLGAGTNLVDHLKLEVARPDLLVDVSRLPLDGIDPRRGGGVRIGTNVWPRPAAISDSEPGACTSTT